jgi:cytochrome P450
MNQANKDPYSVPLDKIDVSDAELFETDTLWGYFERLCAEDPVHYCAEGEFGPYWSVTRHEHIVDLEKNPEIFSSARSIVLKVRLVGGHKHVVLIPTHEHTRFIFS